jgi:hypothetical protein
MARLENDDRGLSDRPGWARLDSRVRRVQDSARNIGCLAPRSRSLSVKRARRRQRLVDCIANDAARGVALSHARHQVKREPTDPKPDSVSHGGTIISHSDVHASTTHAGRLTPMSLARSPATSLSGPGAVAKRSSTTGLPEGNTTVGKPRYSHSWNPAKCPSTLRSTGSWAGLSGHRSSGWDGAGASRGRSGPWGSDETTPTLIDVESRSGGNVAGSPQDPIKEASASISACCLAWVRHSSGRTRFRAPHLVEPPGDLRGPR